MLRSSETETTLLLSGLYLTPQTWSLCSLNVWTHFRSLTSNIFTDLSLDDDAKCFPSGEKETLSTHDAWPDNVPTKSLETLQNKVKKELWPDVLGFGTKTTYTSYSFMWPSSDAVSSIVESGEKHKLLTDIAWPSNVCATFPAATSNMLISPSMAPLAMYLPSGLYVKKSNHKIDAHIGLNSDEDDKMAFEASTYVGNA